MLKFGKYTYPDALGLCCMRALSACSTAYIRFAPYNTLPTLHRLADAREFREFGDSGGMRSKIIE